MRRFGQKEHSGQTAVSQEVKCRLPFSNRDVSFSYYSTVPVPTDTSLLRRSCLLKPGVRGFVFDPCDSQS
ncbi:hypothetical protein AGIG_G8982 [Arapaima gigas]